MSDPESPSPNPGPLAASGASGFGPERSLSVTWFDPQVSARALPTMSGLDFLQAIGRGDLPEPPIFRLLGIRPVTALQGRVEFVFTPDERHYNPIGSVHGGVFATLLDSVMGCAVHTALPAGVGYTTLELKTNILRPLGVDSGEVACVGTIIHVGARTATAEGRMHDARGKLVAHATTTCLILRPDRT
ncbi:PaaI family thioesterase [Deinococcus peraridilitoris]|uniref:Thioesterase domain-containing protein n=1 Tax=Deinococcus peraridilitoris (strain DSM 19664 / LMG 22246 / CIP 109416 / KR-200) TaxID=937777 RepID=K9ZWQ8_DEIPD|nr:PaaI family thioesterase [Deinococcus peraridilitoris]AFZ66016.1 hypothetical protein Deipe_0418 [Deinococcus peraridilitoris DSM 19664]